MATKKDTKTVKKSTTKSTKDSLKEKEKKVDQLIKELEEIKQEKLNVKPNNNMNYGVLIGLIVIGLIVVLIAAFNQDSESSNTNDTTDSTAAEEIVNYTESATTEDYLSMIDDEEVHIFYIARPTCSYCVKFAPVITKVIEDYDLTVYYIDVDEETSDSITSIEDSSDKLADFGTPTIAITQNGEVTYANIGYIDEDTLIDFFKDAGIITE